MATGVIVYLTVSVVLSVLVRVWAGIVDPQEAVHGVAPVIPAGELTVHVKAVPLTPEVRFTGTVVVPEQICCAEGRPATFGTG